MDLLEAQSPLMRIVLELPICILGLSLKIRGKPLEALPETPYRA